MRIHTKAPWFVEKKSDGDYEVQTVHIGEKGVNLIVAYVPSEAADGGADANVMAASPELLKCCKMALAAFEKNWAIDWNELQQAIDKAEGK